MIRGEELQLGDYVLIEGKPRQVESITKKKVGYHIDKQNDKRLYYARLREIEPIWVTHSLLMKVFEPGIDPNHFVLQEFTYNISLSLRREGVCRVKIEEAIFDEDVYFDCWVEDKLHLLQNVLKVFGIKIDWKV